MKKRIAIFTPGGIGAGTNGQGVPPLTQIVTHLSTIYEVHVFSYALVQRPIGGINFHYAPRWISISLGRWSYLKISFLKSHFQKKYAVILSLWGYPSGTLVVLFGIFFKTPTIVWLLGGESANLPQIKYGLMRNRLTQKIILWTCHHASKVIVLSKYQLTNLKLYGYRGEAEVIPIGADSNLFWKSKKERNEILQLVHVSNLNPVKDQTTLIRCFAIIRSKIIAQLKIIGPDFMNGQIQNLAKELKVDNDVEFIGWQNYNEIPQHLARADCFILTSHSESQNHAITEAMTCGLLAASTRVGIMADLGDDYGIVCEVGDPKSLAEQLISISQVPDEWKRKTENSYGWAQEHNLNWTLLKLKEQIEFVLKNDPRNGL